MRYTDRKEFLYDPEVFKLQDTQTALKIYAEWVRKMSPRVLPTFMEVDRDSGEMDGLWHMPLSPRTRFKREIPMPCINKRQKPDWRMTKVGVIPFQRDDFWLSNLVLQELNYFPSRGDLVYYNGYRYMVNKVVIDPTGVWQQTNVWLGIICECNIPPEGDARPLLDASTRAPSEVSQASNAQEYGAALPDPIITKTAVTEFPQTVPDQ